MTPKRVIISTPHLILIHIDQPVANAILPDVAIISDVTVIPDIAVINVDTNNIPISIDKDLILGGELYQLMVVIYYGAGHFICRANINNKAYEYDGQVLDGGFWHINETDPFTSKIRDMRGTSRRVCSIIYRNLSGMNKLRR